MHVQAANCLFCILARIHVPVIQNVADLNGNVLGWTIPFNSSKVNVGHGTRLFSLYNIIIIVVL